MDSRAKQWCFTLNNPEEDEAIDFGDTDYVIIGREVGAEGTPHLQGYVNFTKRKSFKQVKEIVGGAHWEKAKGTAWQNFVYCSKDGFFEEFGVRPTAPLNAHKKKPKDTTYSEALDAETIKEGIEIIKKRKARDYCLHGESIERNLKRARVSSYETLYSIEKFNRAALPLNKTTLICGETHTGKTQFACAHFKNPLVCSHIDKLKMLSPDNDGIVFDDMSFKHWPPEAIIHLLDIDIEREINVRYGTVTIPAHTVKIFTHNSENPFYVDTIPIEQQNAIERRLNRVIVYNKLF